MFIKENIERDAILDIAKKMCLAAKTAPKAKGVDKIVTGILIDKEKNKLADEVERIGIHEELDFFLRDAKNIRACEAIVLIGTKLQPRSVPYCGLCGFEDCRECAEEGARCAFDAGDLGIALGSAVGIAADNRVDNRIMFTAGKAITSLQLLGEDVKIAYGVPLSGKGKNIFFDR